jgi:hypothetical protein
MGSYEKAAALKNFFQLLDYLLIIIQGVWSAVTATLPKRKRYYFFTRFPKGARNSPSVMSDHQIKRAAGSKGSANIFKLLSQLELAN